MKSMTGFAEVDHRGGGLQISVAVRAINGRYLEIRSHLPKEYLSQESAIKKLVRSYILRSTVDLFVHRKIHFTGPTVVTGVNRKLAKNVFKACNDLRGFLNIKEPVSLTHLLRWPEIINVETPQGLLKGEAEVLFKIIQRALQMCNRERLREGRALATELKKNLGHLNTLIQKMNSLVTTNREQAHKVILERWKRFNVLDLDESRVAQEVVLFLDRSDITEELVRLQEHLSAVSNLLKEKSGVGKKLEFFCQELLREVNTIGSKSQKSDLTHLVVEAKSCIERMREQVQNIE